MERQDREDGREREEEERRGGKAGRCTAALFERG